jgi:DNA-binding NtrC family response regulator
LHAQAASSGLFKRYNAPAAPPSKLRSQIVVFSITHSISIDGTRVAHARVSHLTGAGLEALMSHASVLIVDGQEDRALEIQLKTTLQQQIACRIESVRESDIDFRDRFDRVAHLLIPVLPASKCKAERLLSELSAARVGAPILAVLQSEAVTSISADALLCVDDFLLTPLQEAEVLLRARKFLLQRANRPLEQRVNEACGLAQLVGEDPAFVELKRKISLVAQFESTVLLVGETGTGKERCARALHYLSRRVGGPFLPVNCGAIPTELFESELYGREKGAFTGASISQPGFIEAAESGTLFLDEIESLSPAAQVKLLRFLQDQTYYAVGSPKQKQANVWIIAATNVDLPSKIREGTFREDLFYRLAVITLALPPLRQRKMDVPLLAAHFWKLYQAKAGGVERHLSSRAIDALCQYSWPGNVRELENVIQQVIVLTRSQTVLPHDLPILSQHWSAESEDTTFKRSKSLAIEEFEKAYITKLLRRHEGNITHAALEAKKDRRAFGRLIKKYRIAQVRL